VHVARESIELGDKHRAADLAGCRDCRSELRPLLQRIGASASLGFREPLRNRQALALGEVGNGLALRLEP
jgi:hypothetical protein